MHNFEVGDTVTVKQTGYHRMDGKTGVVIYIRGTVGVTFDEGKYGFWADELRPAVTVQEEPKVSRMELVDLLLEYRGVPRHYLYEYPYRADESDALIGKAEDVLDAIMEKLGVEL